MQILKSIKEKYLKRNEEKIERKVKNILSKIKYYNKVMCFIPVLDVVNLWMINKKIKISSNFKDEMNSLLLFRFLSSGCFLLLSLSLFFEKPPQDEIIFGYIAVSLFTIIHLLLSILQSLYLSPKNIKDVIFTEENKNVLDKEDFEILKENIDHKVLSDFMVKNDFKIRHCDLSKLEYEIEKDKEYTIQKGKAMEILLSKSSVIEKVEI